MWPSKQNDHQSELIPKIKSTSGVLHTPFNQNYNHSLSKQKNCFDLKHISGKLTMDCEESLNYYDGAPYITQTNEELEGNFLIMEEEMPALPCEIENLTVELPPLSDISLKTLVLDLDGTLIQSSENTNFPCDHSRQISACFTSKKGELIDIFFYVRPHVSTFLQMLSKFYEIIIFTASTEEYAESIIKILDPGGDYTSKILSRNSCIVREEILCLKDLRILKNRSLEKVIIIDNMPFSFSGQLENGIYIPTYDGSENDDHLLAVMQFLLKLQKVPDVRPLVKKFAGLEDLMCIFKSKRQFILKEQSIKESASELDEDHSIPDELESTNISKFII